LSVLLTLPLFAGDGVIRKSGKAVPGQYIVALEDRDGSNAAEHATALANAYGGRILAVYDAVLSGFAIELPEAAAQALARNPKVRFVEENAVVRISNGQTSTTYQNTSFSADWQWGLWHLDRTDQRQLWDRGLDGKFGYCATGQDVVAYIVDTGIRADHAEFGGRVMQGVDFSDAPGTATDPCNSGRTIDGGHGTAVASLLGGGNLGVAKGIDLVPVRVLNCEGEATNAKVLQGLQWIRTDPSRAGRRAVINMSFYYVDQANVQSLREVTDELKGVDGIATFVSANNKGLTEGAQPAANDLSDACRLAPASMARGAGGPVVSVGGTMVGSDGNGLSTGDWVDYRWPGSSFGSCVDIWAPAHGMRVASYTTTDGTRTDSSGTSYSSPIVAGIAARRLQAAPGTTPDQLWDWLRVPAGPWGATSGATTTMSYGGAPLIRDLKTTPHSRMVFFRDICPDDPVGPCIPLVITRHPDSWKLPNTAQVTLSVTATGTSPRYQWYRGVRGDVSNKISGAVYPMLTTDPMSNQSQSYWVRVYDDCGNEFYSETATITHVLTCPAISINAQPAPSTTIPEGSSVTLAVSATSENPLSYQWEWKSSAYSPWYPVHYATGPSLTVTPSGSTFYQVRIRNGCSERYSNVAWVSVQPIPRDHTVALRTYYWNFVGAEGGGGAGVNATAGAAYEWERFVIRDLNGGDLVDGDLVTLKSYNGHYVVAEWCGGPGPDRECEPDHRGRLGDVPDPEHGRRALDRERKPCGAQGLLGRRLLRGRRVRRAQRWRAGSR
jgi:hypothetical protein